MNKFLQNEHCDVGNAAAMREALSCILDKIAELRERNPNVVPCVRDAIDSIENWASYALSKPSRNCDVGTAEEQADRHSDYCSMFIGTCTGCPLEDAQDCELAWAQMPYEAKGGAGERERCGRGA